MCGVFGFFDCVFGCIGYFFGGFFVCGDYGIEFLVGSVVVCDGFDDFYCVGLYGVGYCCSFVVDEIFDFFDLFLYWVEVLYF